MENEIETTILYRWFSVRGLVVGDELGHKECSGVLRFTLGLVIFSLDSGKRWDPCL